MIVDWYGSIGSWVYAVKKLLERNRGVAEATARNERSIAKRQA